MTFTISCAFEIISICKYILSFKLQINTAHLGENDFEVIVNISLICFTIFSLHIYKYICMYTHTVKKKHTKNKNNRPKVESFMLNPTLANQELTTILAFPEMES